MTKFRVMIRETTTNDLEYVVEAMTNREAKQKATRLHQMESNEAALVNKCVKLNVTSVRVIKTHPSAESNPLDE